MACNDHWAATIVTADRSEDSVTKGVAKDRLNSWKNDMVTWLQIVAACL